jgi:hypothetical protein
VSKFSSIGNAADYSTLAGWRLKISSAFYRRQCGVSVIALRTTLTVYVTASERKAALHLLFAMNLQRKPPEF